MMRNRNKLFFVIAIVSLFSVPGLAQTSYGHSETYPQGTTFELAIKSKCKASVTSFRCKDGMTFDDKKLSGWKKNPVLPNFYEFTEFVEPDIFIEHEEKRFQFIGKACLSGTWARLENREIFTCAENSTKQQIIFSIYFPEKSVDQQARGFELVCDKKGGEDWLKMIYPMAAWKELPKTPHFYQVQPDSKEKGKELEDAIRAKLKEIPPGCRHLKCSTELMLLDWCEEEKP